MSDKTKKVETKVLPLKGAVAVVFRYGADTKVDPDRVKVVDDPGVPSGEMHDVDFEPNVENCFLPQSVDMRRCDGKTEAFVWQFNDGRTDVNHTSQTAAADISAQLSAESRQKSVPRFLKYLMG